MSKFDKTINSILNHLIFEETDVEPSDDEIIEAQKIIDETRKQVELDFNKDRATFIQNAEEKVNSDEEGVDRFFEYFKSAYDNFKKTLNEQTKAEPSSWSDSILSGLTDLAKKAGSYISGSFEDAMDRITDYAVEKTPTLMNYLIGKDTYDSIRSEIENMENKTLYKIFAFVDPTGVLSWTYLENAKRLYEENLGTENEDLYTLNLLGASLAVIPGLRYIRYLTLPFRLLSKISPFMNPARAGLIARAVAKEIKGPLNLSQRVSRASNIASKTGRLGEGVINFGKALTKASRPLATLAKASTVAAAGDVPAMVKGWMEKGAKMVDQVPQQKTLGRIPSFQRITTQP